MGKLAIVEDTAEERAALVSCLETYRRKMHENISWICFENAYDFLESREHFDIVFFDIMLPGMNGMEAAEKLREYDSDIIIVFTTNMTSFAVKSYEVDALDYILKPISYERVEFKLTKALNLIRARGETSVTINNEDGKMIRISSGQIYYVEVTGHKLAYYTEKGVFCEKGSLSQLSEVLEHYNFARCNACYLVNLRYIFAVDGYFLEMKNGDRLKISQPKKKEFVGKLANYMGQGKC